MGRPFEVRLARDEEVSRVSIAEGTVRVSVDGAEASATFGTLETAACVFEANVRALEAMGFVVVETSFDDAIPGCLSVFDDEGPDPLTWIRWRGPVAEAAFIDVADGQSIFDGTGRLLAEAAPLAHFDPTRSDPVDELRHALRRLLAHPAGRRAEALELQLAFAHDELLDRVVASPLAERLTHLTLSTVWADGRATARSRDLSSELPKLRSLSATPWMLSHFFESAAPRLRHVWMGSDWGRDVPALSLSESLDRLAKLAPQLETLSIHTVDTSALSPLLRHPLVARLRVLDIAHPNVPADLDVLLTHREHLDRSSLESVFITRHLVPPNELARLADWPTLCPIDHMRDHERYRAFVREAAI